MSKWKMFPKKLWVEYLMTCILMIILSIPAAAQDAAPVDVSGKVSITTANERSTMDRRTRMVTSTAEVTIANVSSENISVPLHAVIEITDTDYDNVQIVGAVEGATDATYDGKSYYDLNPSQDLTDGILSEGETVTFYVRYVRYYTTRFRYSIITYGVLDTTPENLSPTANAGSDATYALPLGQNDMEITLDGSQSDDSDGTVEGYVWTGIPDPNDVIQPTITLSLGTYEFTLVVTDDGDAQSSPDTVTIIVQESPNAPPVADAGPDATYTLPQGQSNMEITLDGSGSSDEDGTVESYVWTRNPDSDPDPDDEIQPTITLSPGTYEFTLVVTDDGGGQSSPDTVTIIVQESPNALPIADAGPDATYTLPQGQSNMEITLDGSGSSDEDGTVEGYAWSGAPDPADERTPVIVLGVGIHEFTLVVTDNEGAQGNPDTVTITILETDNIPPEANAGPDQTYTLIYGQTQRRVILDGSASNDPDGSIDSYTWTGETGSPDPGDIAAPEITLPAGTYIFTLVVIDDDGAVSAADTVSVMINAPPDVGGPPTISAVPQAPVVEEGQTVTIQVSGADPDNDILTLSASPKLDNADFVTTPGVDATGTFSFTPDSTQQGIHVVAFKAIDPLGYTNTRTVQITVNNVNRSPMISGPGALTVDEGGLLTIPIQASDPDGDILTLTADPLPDNAIFIPATGTITFTPDFDQQGTYSITCQVSDGELSAGLVVDVAVNDVSDGSGGPQELVLNVDEVESPTFLTSTRITGTVNSSGPSQARRITSALITGMTPATGEQGETLDVLLTGQASGDFETHFAENISQADFGEGIIVNSITVNSPTGAEVNIAIEPDAQEGPRSATIVTDNEAAISALAFNVTKGQAGVTGTLIDPDTGSAIAGAVVSIQGTNITTSTNAYGTFTFTDVPSGEHVIIINAQDHDLIIMEINSQVGAIADVGTVSSSATVFDPSAPPSVSMFSVIGRGAGLLFPNLDKPGLEHMITDTILLVGDNEAGVMDAYGNPLNPQLGAEAQFSLTAAGVAQIADRILRRETISLSRLLYAFSHGFKWGGTGDSLSLEGWIQLLQEIVDHAWADPTNPDNYLPVIIFNNGNMLSPEPPKISHLTRLNPLQAYLFSSSLLVCMDEMTTP